MTVESLEELNKICQRPHYKTQGNWMARHITRDAALPLTWLLLHTNVTANQVTLVSLVVGLVGVVLFASVSTTVFLTGAFLLQLWYYLDHVDGQIARYRKTATLSGRFFDYIVHHLIHGALFFCLGFYAFQYTNQVMMIVLGFVCAFSVTIFNLINDTKCKTFFERLMLCHSFYTISNANEPGITVTRTKAKSFASELFSWIHKLVEIHVLMNVLLFMAVGEQWFGLPAQSRVWLVVFYSLIMPFLAVTKITYIIFTKKIDQEFEQKISVQ